MRYLCEWEKSQGFYYRNFSRNNWKIASKLYPLSNKKEREEKSAIKIAFRFSSSANNRNHTKWQIYWSFFAVLLAKRKRKKLKRNWKVQDVLCCVIFNNNIKWHFTFFFFLMPAFTRFPPIQQQPTTKKVFSFSCKTFFYSSNSERSPTGNYREKSWQTGKWRRRKP